MTVASLDVRVIAAAAQNEINLIRATLSVFDFSDDDDDATNASCLAGWLLVKLSLRFSPFCPTAGRQ